MQTQRNLLLCEYMRQRRQQGVKRDEWVSGLDLLCIGCPHLVSDPRKLKNALHWRTVYATLAEELEAQGNEVDARQYRRLVRDLDTHINEMKITQASIEDGKRKPVFLQLASAPYDAVVINAEA